ncbi:MAG TPA: EpsD family peptidyl-prolyl cis-trans isomerase [Burkholderiales bacterium]|nr:EpsD family peptidyl-prolyl cis-trans isomerase [Burkholderiales bacterium]
MNRLTAMFSLCLALCACGQSAAPVSVDAVSLPELDAMLARNPQAVAALAARAREQRLERTPSVVQALESAQGEILARAYLQLVAQRQPRPSAEEVRKYYAEHPELFAQRRLFSLEQIEVTCDAARRAELVAALREHAVHRLGTDAIAEWLRAGDVQHAVTRGVRAAEHIPLELLPRLQAMQAGELQMVETDGQTFFLVRLLGTKAAPLDEAAAAPHIEQFLLKRRWREALDMELRRL